jgi:hypothetical protein
MRMTTMLFRERSNVTRKETITFSAPGIYYPPYGKTAFLLQGQGVPGNAPSGGNYAGTNPPSGGNLAGTNPSTYGPPYIAYYTPGSPAYAGQPIGWYSNSYPGSNYYNPYQPGTAYYNPATPGNAGPSNAVLGVTLPGGAVSTAAPIIGYVPITVGYANAGVPISVPTGGYVKIQNT